MLFNSLEFIQFFLTVYILYIIFPHKIQNIILIFASYVFYGAWDYRFLSLIILSTVVDYTCAIQIKKSNQQKTRKIWLLVSVFVNLAILGTFKYFGFFVNSLVDLVSLFGFEAAGWHLDLILPIGISFYTFQTMGYTIDVYRGKITPERNVLTFALYVAFFPQLVAGPIERASRFLPQIRGKRSITCESLSQGAWLVLLGYFQKVFVADNLAPIVDRIFSGTIPLSGATVLLGIYCFAFQIYGDFAGYSNIARGVARFMGFELINNFASPFLSANPAEFWHRWHISLSSWLRDYVYIPLGGSHGSRAATYRNLIVTMALGGLWHGAAWTFVVWGLFHGVILAGHRAMKGVTSHLPKIFPFPTVVLRLLGIFVTFHLICVGWLLFRAESLEQAIAFSLALICDFRIAPGLGLGAARTLLGVTSILIILDLLEWRRKTPFAVFGLRYLVRALLYFVMTTLIVVFGEFGGQDFIYFQF